MVSSNYIKRAFSGNLRNEINLFDFSINEAQLLKCQILKILHECDLTFKGLFEFDEESNKTTLNQDFVVPHDELLSVDSYVYSNQQILSNGRMTLYIPKSIDEEEREEFIQNQKEKYQKVLPYSEIQESQKQNWKFKSVGNSIKINSLNDDSEQSLNIVHIKNTDWKGVNIIISPSKNQFEFFYCGYGTKESQVVLPLAFPLIQNCPKEDEEYPEPNGEIVEEKIEETEDIQSEHNSEKNEETGEVNDNDDNDTNQED
jgi:hypothetical protein